MSDFSAAWAAAQKAGREAGEAALPTPMNVYEADPLTGARLEGGKSWHVSEGVCGFAWVNVKPGNSKLANWLRKNGHGRTDSYAGGLTIWISQFGQSYERKIAAAHAIAETLKAETGYSRIYADGRLD